MDLDDFLDILKVVVGGALLIFGVYSCSTSKWFLESQARQEAQRAADSKPHVIRSTDDGCKVYAWRDNGGTGAWHYFTRCGSTVTTERNY